MQPTAQQAMVPEILKRLNKAGVIAVLVLDELKHAIPVARALLDGGVDAIELTLRTPVALDAARVIKKEFPEMILGIGTVLTIGQVKAIADAGVDFAVAPGCNPRVIDAARKQRLSFAPGVMTPTDIELAIESGCRVLKYFPAESSGGLAHLASMAAPYHYLGLTFIPLGGLHMKNARTYLASPLITAIGGSWVAKRDLIRSEDWEAITNHSKEIRNLVRKTREEIS
jgi:2-dehydro-3-deoxyphosphogluconate aldolase/(4S)-4-hydroxy-2-oxoglutarate aldolase